MAWEWLTTSIKGYTFGYSPTFDLNSTYIRTPFSDYIPGNSPLAMYNENGLPEIERNLDITNDGYLTFKLSYDGTRYYYFEMDGTYYDIALPYKTTFSNDVNGMTVLNMGIAIDEDNKWAAPVLFYTDTQYENQYVYLMTVFLSATAFRPPSTPYENTAQARGKDLYNAIKLLQQPVTKYSNGGGATHVARANGQLKDLSSNLRNVIMIAAGGGGGMLYNDAIYEGADAGGIQGNKDNSATQSTGYAFGEGESAVNLSAGGSGLYGGYKGVIPGPVIPDWATPYLENISKFILDGNDYLAVSADYDWMQGKWEGQYTHSYYNSSTDWTINSSRVNSLALLDIHIDGSDNSYSVTGNFVNKNDAFSNYGSSGYRAHLTYSNGTTHVSDTDGTIEQSPFTQTFSSLESALSYCQDHFKHCGVYVNNELWISAEAE